MSMISSYGVLQFVGAGSDMYFVLHRIAAVAPVHALFHQRDCGFLMSGLPA